VPVSNARIRRCELIKYKNSASRPRFFYSFSREIIRLARLRGAILRVHIAGDSYHIRGVVGLRLISMGAEVDFAGKVPVVTRKANVQF
jgi:hypothetical protein